MALAPDTAATLVHEIFDFQRAVRCMTASTLRGEGTGPALHFVLRLVGEGECRANRLAARLGIGAPVLSRHIADLVEQGLVIRRKDPNDGRAQLVAITSSGVEKLRRLDAHRAAVFQSQLCDWDEEDALRAVEALHRLTRSLATSATMGRVTST